MPQAVVCGFEWGIAAPDCRDVRRRLRLVDPEQRGFAYEGATMAFTIRDSVRGGQDRRDCCPAPGERHIFLAYIGIGFAMARLPRPLWKKVLPDLADSHYFPTMSWLAVDGYGFDRAYFDTDACVDQQAVPAPYPWEGNPEYFPRAVDQGIGRALWFIHGADTRKVAEAVKRFAAAAAGRPVERGRPGLDLRRWRGPEGLAALRRGRRPVPRRGRAGLGVRGEGPQLRRLRPAPHRARGRAC